MLVDVASTAMTQRRTSDPPAGLLACALLLTGACKPGTGAQATDCTLGLGTGASDTSDTSAETSDSSVPCGSIATGQLSISGSRQLDGFFAAVADIQAASRNFRGTLEAELRAMGEIYDMGNGVVDAAFVGDLMAEIRADLGAKTSGGARSNYIPPQCSVSVRAAVSAQASCEASTGCEVSANPGEVPVLCEGSCTGSCAGACDGDISCNPVDGSANCDVGCEGSCVVEGGATCDGTCRGACTGPCSITNANGSCAGLCDGVCEGVCERTGMVSCGGTCYGVCHATVTPPECDAGPIRCSGACIGECFGGCAGVFTPPSASADCRASAGCQPQAWARAEANFSCAAPSLQFTFEFQPSVPGSGRAAFSARLARVQTHLGRALQAAASARGLVDGEVNGNIVLDPSPVEDLAASVEAFLRSGADGFAELDIPTGGTTCLLPALAEAGEVLTQVNADLSFTATASRELFAFAEDPSR